MLSLPGKAPFHDLYSAAREFIWHRYHSWVDQSESDPEGHLRANLADDDKVWTNFRQEPFDIATTDLETLKLNIESAAKLACLNLLVSKGGSIEILTPYGATPRIPVFVFGRPVSVKGMPSMDRSISPRTFLGSTWQRVFLTQPVFETMFTHGILNWHLGTIDTNPLEALRKIREAGHTTDADERVYIYGRSGLLPMLRPYQGCPIIVPEDWLSAFSDKGAAKFAYLDPSTTDMPLNVSELSPAKAIIAFTDLNPTATKGEVKAALYPNMSARQFSHYFTLAAEEKPDLRRPGRKPKSRG